jgi:signal transduction histidine kinase
VGSGFRWPFTAFRGEADGNGDAPSLSRSVWRWQLFLAFSAVTVAAVVALLDPAVFSDVPYTAGMALLIAVTLVAMSAPWERLGAPVAYAVPALDIVAIGLMAASEQVRLGFLWVFPIVWIATHYSAGWLAGGLGGVAAMLVLAQLSAPLSPFQVLRLLVVLVCLGFIGATISIGAGRARASGRLLRRQSAQLQTALERSRLQEQQSHRLLDALPNGVAQVEPSGTIRSANRAFRRLYGLDDVPRHHPSRAVEYRTRRGDPVPLEETIVARAARGEVFEGLRVWLFDAEGRWHALEAAASRLDDGTGSADTVVIVSDVTAQSDAAHERHSLARNISHELRSPLTAVVGHADLLMERVDIPDTARAQLAIVENAAVRMQRLVSSFLEENTACDDRAPFDLSAVIAASVEAFGPAAVVGGVTLIAADADPLPVVGDAFRLRQAVDNVIGNAIKYTPRGGHVAISAGTLDDGGVEVRVTDSGIGISSHDLPHIFERHFRAASARDAGLPGTGLGMAISRDIVRSHGGSIEIESELDHGTAVTLHLPAPTRQKAA